MTCSGLASSQRVKATIASFQYCLEELEVERNRYKWLFENALHGIFQASLSGKLRAANPALAAMLDDSSVVHTLERCARFDALFVNASTGQQLRDLLLAQGHVTGQTTWLQGASGHQVPVAITLIRKPAELAGDEDLIEGFVADITERERARQHLETLNAHLEARVADRTQALERLNEELRSARDAAEFANQSKDRYLAAASHDLLQPMNAARLLVASLQERLTNSDNLALIESVQNSLEGAEAILSDLLDISRLDHGQVQPQLRHFKLDDILSNLADEFTPVAQRKGLTLRYVPSHQAVTSDPYLLSRIVRNFLANACRYTHRGGICLGVRRHGDDSLAVQVVDSGIGIPESDYRLIFREFHQLNATRARDRQGVGLGLAIVERISQRLEHPLSVRSAPGQGSCFAVTVPRASGISFSQAPAPSAPLSADDEFEGLRVLILDNEPTILQGMALLLTEWKISCDTALDVDTAKACQEAPDMLLVDLHLDDHMTGLEAIRQLRQHWHDPHLPAAILSADRSDHWQRRLRHAGVPQLNKPVRPGKLRALLRSLLNG
ncbi:PAS domain-containing hybrid sensor histidine kinase/response regulator [Halomonas sp. TD01]|uniref:PAS domain-containing hybrid sensor histidine kinase/response regulator n=1 Tax=Halomonas sp. TD01 TaxID=999141 RepID=UPI001E6B7797|nr:NahK/ErcS family hybrid sensor histidine kinase/response regulator [Halomonas sp. TD01]CAH1043026.1 Two-component system sensor histidine kinase [Halomonas sp. TD01]